MGKVSVIVPVYNVGKYLRQCVDSILSQTFGDFELLLIDDGSTDGSGDICDEYAAKDARVKVFHKLNGGVSSARNLGLDNASGEYILFVDSDDFLCTRTAIEQLLAASISCNADIVRGEYIEVDDNGNFFSSHPISQKRQSFAGRSLSKLEFLKFAVNGDGFIWLLFCRRGVFEGFRFDEQRVYLEDMLLIHQLVAKKDCKCMYFPDLRFYAYRNRPGSATNFLPLRMLEDSFSMSAFFVNNASGVNGFAFKRFYAQRSLVTYYYSLKTAAINYYSNRNEIIEKQELPALCKAIRKSIVNAPFVSKYIWTVLMHPRMAILLFYILHKARGYFRN